MSIKLHRLLPQLRKLAGAIVLFVGVFATFALGCNAGPQASSRKEPSMAEPSSNLGFPIWVQRQLSANILFAGPTGSDVLGRLRKLRENYLVYRPEDLATDSSWGADHLVYMFSLDLTDRHVQTPAGFTPSVQVFGVEGREHPALKRVAMGTHVLVFVSRASEDDEMVEQLRAAMWPERRNQVLRIARGEDFGDAMKKALSAIEKGQWE
jgi:hypothetical protein